MKIYRTAPFLLLGLGTVLSVSVMDVKPGSAFSSSGYFCTCEAARVSTVDDTAYANAFTGFCQEPYLNAVINGYELWGSIWNTWGYEDPCNEDLPFGRFLIADVVLASATANPTGINNAANRPLLDWARDYTVGQVIDSEPECQLACTRARYSNNAGNISFHWNLKFANCPSTSVGLECSGAFFDADVTQRAAVIVHEARHRDNKSHTSTGRDPNFAYWGASAYEIAWLRDYAYLGVAWDNAVNDKRRRCAALINNNLNILSDFDTKPYELADLSFCL